MDSLALLCNLHGDGPATLAGLRELGCHELFEVLQVDAEVLGTLFAGNLRVAERFGREAKLLAERLGEQPPAGIAEPEEGLYDAVQEEYGAGLDIEELTPGSDASTSVVLTPFPALSSGGPESAAMLGIEPLPAPDLPTEVAPRDSSGANGPVVDAVRDVWARLDNCEPATVTQADSSLADAGLAGLGPEFVAKLGEAGIQTLGELLDGDVLALSTATRIPYTKLAHLQFLGKQKLGPEQRDKLRPYGHDGASQQPKKRAAKIERDSLQEDDFSEPYRQALKEDGPAGPFA